MMPPSPSPPGTESVPVCPLCAEPGRTVLHERLTDRVAGIDRHLWTLYRCIGCGSGYLDPRFDAGHIGSAYEGGYYTHQVEAATADPVPATLVGRWRRALRNGYLNARYGSALRPASMLGAWLVPLLPEARLTMDHWVKFLAPPSGGRRLLDVGCGHGLFLARMRDMGWEVRGVEPDPAAVAAARGRGLEIEPGLLTETTFPAESFDAVTMSHVIEHLPDPLATLRLCHRVLRPGGLLWVCTPNLASQGHQRFGRYWVHLDPPRHLVLFNPGSLGDALRRTGFDVAAPLRNLAQARVTYPWSAQIARTDREVPPTEDFAGVDAEAAAADQRAACSPAIDEEVTYLARKPAR